MPTLTPGTCSCREYADHSFLPPTGSGGDYAPPPDLGFATCAARVDYMAPAEKTKSWSDARLAPGAWWGCNKLNSV